MASKLFLGLCVALLLVAVYAENKDVYIRGRQKGPYTVPGVAGVFDQSPSEGWHGYQDGKGNEFQHQEFPRYGPQQNEQQQQPQSPTESQEQDEQRSGAEQPTKAQPVAALLLHKEQNGSTISSSTAVLTNW